MKCLNRLRRRHHEPARHPAAADTAGGAEAKAKARVDLADTRATWPEVRRVAASLREIRIRNDFAEQLEEIFHGGHQ